jgi:hypothetical protein
VLEAIEQLLQGELCALDCVAMGTCYGGARGEAKDCRDGADQEGRDERRLHNDREESDDESSGCDAACGDRNAALKSLRPRLGHVGIEAEHGALIIDSDCSGGNLPRTQQVVCSAG